MVENMKKINEKQKSNINNNFITELYKIHNRKSKTDETAVG